MRIEARALFLDGIDLPDVECGIGSDIVIPEDASLAIMAMVKTFLNDREKAARYVRYILYTVGTPDVNGLSYEQVQAIVGAVDDGLEARQGAWCDECVKLERDRLEAFGIVCE